MAKMTRRDGEQLSRMITTPGGAMYRADWNSSAVYASIQKTVDKYADALPAATIMHAIIHAASNRYLRSPGTIPEPGAHWAAATAHLRTADGSYADDESRNVLQVLRSDAENRDIESHTRGHRAALAALHAHQQSKATRV